MSTATIVAALRRKYIRKFREARATTPATAIIPSENGVRNSLIFKKLVRDGIFVAVGERYYLDEQREQVVRKKRQSIAGIALIILLIALIIAFSQSFYR